MADLAKRALGATGLSALPLMLGGNAFGWTSDKQASFAVLDAFAAQGGSLIDTADVYSAWVPGNAGGESEAIIGEWMAARKCRPNMLIATKVGLLDGEGGKGLKASRIRAAVEASLKRLRTDYIDIYFAHRDDPATPLEETLGALDGLVRAGKVRVLGASNYTPDRLSEALRMSDTPFAVVEPHFNLIRREDYEGALRDLVTRHGLACVPYYGLANGYLTGKYRSRSDVVGTKREKWLVPLMDGKGPAVLAAMDKVAEETGASHAAIALAWVLAQPGVSAPIASATNPAQVGGLFEALALSLTADHLRGLDEAGR